VGWFWTHVWKCLEVRVRAARGNGLFHTWAQYPSASTATGPYGVCLSVCLSAGRSWRVARRWWVTQGGLQRVGCTVRVAEGGSQRVGREAYVAEGGSRRIGRTGTPTTPPEKGHQHPFGYSLLMKSGFCRQR